jgi:hypothetical protein
LASENKCLRSSTKIFVFRWATEKMLSYKNILNGHFIIKCHVLIFLTVVKSFVGSRRLNMHVFEGDDCVKESASKWNRDCRWENGRMSYEEGCSLLFTSQPTKTSNLLIQHRQLFCFLFLLKIVLYIVVQKEKKGKWRSAKKTSPT